MGTIIFAVALLSVAGLTLLQRRGDRSAPSVTTTAEG